MAISNTRDPGEVAAALRSWLPGVLRVDGPVEVTDLVVPQASGMSNETVLLTATWPGNRHELVVRIPAENGIFDDTDFGREARVMTAVRERTGLPVPEVLGHEPTGDVLGSEILLMTRLYGDVPSDDPLYVAGGWFQDLTDAQRGVVFDGALQAIAAIGTFDPAEAGLGELARTTEGATVLERELAHQRRFYAWGNGGRPCPTIDRALDIVCSSVPDDVGPTVLLWGDVRLGNLMFGPDQTVTGVLDWEMATHGHPGMDFAYFLFCNRMFAEGIGIPEQSGFPSRAEAVARYEEITGAPVRHLDWYEAFSALRASIAVNRMGNLMIEDGLLPHDAEMPFNNPASTTLAAVLGLPSPSGTQGWVTGHRAG